MMRVDSKGLLKGILIFIVVEFNIFVVQTLLIHLVEVFFISTISTHPMNMLSDPSVLVLTADHCCLVTIENPILEATPSQ
uniref:Uncharacterized protein n=1 Tax=Anguilla anguilla TaxID=7936 RepID=A0A0E9X5L9_ANGAN